MTKLKIEKSNVEKAYTKADTKGKELLSNLFAGQVILSDNITDRIRTIQDVYDIAGADPAEYEITYNATDEEKWLIRARQVRLIVSVYNEGWQPDFGNGGQYKYYPWMQYTPGSGFSFVVGDITYSGTYVGARLCFKSSALCKHAVTTFADIYNDFFTL